jgi:hypothetical protein
LSGETLVSSSTRSGLLPCKTFGAGDPRGVSVTFIAGVFEYMKLKIETASHLLELAEQAFLNLCLVHHTSVNVPR